MIIKLKCVDNVDMFGEVSDYLTVGKIYDAENCSDMLYRIIDDDGEAISALLSGCAHAKWEVVN